MTPHRTPSRVPAPASRPRRGAPARAAVTLITLALLATALAGCITATDTAEPLQPQATPPRPGQGIDEAKLTKPQYDVLPEAVEYVAMSLDDVRLYTRVFLPDGEGPWPTIFVLSPYNNLGRAFEPLGAVPGMVDHYAPRGYAVVHADVRGTGNSEGCMDMMGRKEQQDAHDLVEWIAAQPWSDGKVGMWGVSYVGTTPHEAAIMAPPHLTTIVTVAGVTNQWRNTYQNGVPYDGRHYPLTYEAMVGAPPPTDVERGPAWLKNAADGACDQERALLAMSPGTYEKGVYTAYWADRNLTRGAADVQVPVFYSQGFTDRAVNPMEAVHWFNALDVPKKAFLHQEGHQYPPRDDFLTTVHAWFDHWLKGIDNGVMDTPTVEVQTNLGAIRLDTAWPPVNVTRRAYHLTPGALTPEAPETGQETYLADMARNPASRATTDPAADAALEAATGLPTTLEYATEPLDAPLYMAGSAKMRLQASVDAENTYFLLSLYDVTPDGEWLEVSEGWFNAHLREGFHKSAPLTPGEAYTFTFDFEPREYAFQEGHRIGLRVLGHDDRVFPVDELVTENTVMYGPGASALTLPVVEDPQLHAPPDTV